MSLQDDIVETVCDFLIEDFVKYTTVCARSNGRYWKIEGQEELFSSSDAVSKLFKIAEEKILQHTTEQVQNAE